MNKKKLGLGVVLLLVILIAMGPSPEKPKLDTQIPRGNLNGGELELAIGKSESQFPNLKPNNQARIIWYDSAKQPTPFSVVYLHGFSASQGEGEPIHQQFARRYGCNLYLSRLEGHGLEDPEAFLNLTPENLMESAKTAISIGQQIGKKTILMSTSTGGTLSLYLASGNPDIHSLIMYSPNVELYDPTSFVLGSPWGLQITRIVLGGNYREWTPSSPAEKQYWTSRYRIESLVTLKSLLNSTMGKETFSKVSQPTFMGYYYRDEENQDNTVSVPALLEMFDQLGTPADQKRKVAFPLAQAHVIASQYISQDWKTVRSQTFLFAEEVLGLERVD